MLSRSEKHSLEKSLETLEKSRSAFLALGWFGRQSTNTLTEYECLHSIMLAEIHLLCCMIR